MLLYALCIFLSAFLLFQVQPMISRYILPFFGGTPAVWSTVQLFFQVFLTGGYAYAAWLVGRVPAKRQAWVHVAFLAVSLAALVGLGLAWPSPVTPDASWKPLNVDTPLQDIFKLLLVAVGLPYFLLATNSPLMQSWFNRSQPGRSPYWLYALSNSGSLLGLLAYPFVIEPNLTLRSQGWLWAGGYALFAGLAGYGALRARRTPQVTAAAPEAVSAAAERPSLQLQALWILLSAIASTLLLAVTSQITQEVAATPFLWVLPLTLYLLSFILTYSGERWYPRRLYGVLLVLASAGFVWALVDTQAHFVALIAVYCFLLFVSVMICNGETYRLRPAPAYLTRFYLMTSLGGALGGAAVNLLAPVIFKGYWELPISFGLVWTLALALFVTRKSTDAHRRMRFVHNVLLAATLLLSGVLGGYSLAGGKTAGSVFEGRNFYGVVRVRPVYADEPAWRGYTVVHGITIHGLQFAAPERRKLPTVYYTEQSGVGLALLSHPQYGRGMRVGVLGLGVGTLAFYAQPGDVYRLYEINPIMVDLAEGQGDYFHFLADSTAENVVVLGDARISLERELAANGSNRFDVLVLDVFSSDSVPVHLVTQEAFDLYLKHLAPGGVIAVNISNRHLDLLPVLWRVAEYNHLHLALIPNEGDGRRVFPSNWALLSPDAQRLAAPAIAARTAHLDGYEPRIALWSDDFNNLFQILK